jgi:hypothetical protein
MAIHFNQFLTLSKSTAPVIDTKAEAFNVVLTRVVMVLAVVMVIPPNNEGFKEEQDMDGRMGDEDGT